ncbi:MAG: hypothetical protein HYW45_00805 [Candidatus Daviesbacteria bacterium]|nr:MAG: hypothetical protein HYW45_00805 [Candidatus Daviesbacteria bacterium]
MENSTADNLIKPLAKSSQTVKIMVAVLISTIALGGITGYLMANKNPISNLSTGINGTPPKSAQQDSKTFRDFAEGVIKPKSTESDNYSEGTHILQRDNNPTPVALTSSVVDLSQYEGKKVRIYGETQKAVTEGWLMDVGKVEIIK